MKIVFILLSVFYVSTSIIAQVDEVSSTSFIIDVEGHALKVPYYFTKPLEEKNDAVKRLVIVQHGTNRNAATYRLSMLTAAVEAGQSEESLIIAPQFLTRDDIETFSLANDYLFWYNSGWKIGNLSRDNVASLPRPARISSFEVLDRLIMHILDTDNFPNITEIVITGFSAGGQVVNRYAGSNRMHSQINQNHPAISIRYLVGGPSSYLYFNAERRVMGSMGQFEEAVTSCTGFNEYKYGLTDLNSYLSTTGASTIITQYEQRKILYAVGENDNNPSSSSLDTSCEALLQGEQRLERANIFLNYLTHFYSATIEDQQQLIIVPGVGHNHNALFRFPAVRDWIFKTSLVNSIENPSKLTSKIRLEVYPNPVNNQRVTLNYFLEEAGFVSLKIINLAGKTIKSFNISYQSPGNHHVVWDTEQLVEGVCFALLQTERETKVVKLVLQ